jgi:hypothetical protein
MIGWPFIRRPMAAWVAGISDDADRGDENRDEVREMDTSLSPLFGELGDFVSAGTLLVISGFVFQLAALASPGS